MKKASSVFSLIILLTIPFGHSVRAQPKQPWNPQARGATIGAGIGGVAGAILDKRNRGVGIAIGGILGGATGYAIGKHTDNKNKEAARIAAAREAERQQAAREAAFAASKATTDREAAHKEAASREAAAAHPVATHETAVAKVDREPAVARPDTAPVQTAVLSAASPAPALSLGVAAGPAPELHSYFLPNPSYGDASAPYGLSKYRRKSW